MRSAANLAIMPMMKPKMAIMANVFSLLMFFTFCCKRLFVAF
jgi:hypothetical protein